MAKGTEVLRAPRARQARMRGPPGNGQRPDTVAQGHGGFTFVSGLLRAACFRELTSVASDRPDVHWGPATWQAGGPQPSPGSSASARREETRWMCFRTRHSDAVRDESLEGSEALSRAGPSSVRRTRSEASPFPSTWDVFHHGRSTALRRLLRRVRRTLGMNLARRGTRSFRLGCHAARVLAAGGVTGASGSRCRR